MKEVFGSWDISDNFGRRLNLNQFLLFEGIRQESQECVICCVSGNLSETLVNGQIVQRQEVKEILFGLTWSQSVVARGICGIG